jgi:hypothetical protein
MFIKFCSEDEPKVLRSSDSRISFVHRETGSLDKLQVRGLVIAAILLTSSACFATHPCGFTFLLSFSPLYFAQYITFIAGSIFPLPFFE